MTLMKCLRLATISSEMILKPLPFLCFPWNTCLDMCHVLYSVVLAYLKHLDDFVTLNKDVLEAHHPNEDAMRNCVLYLNLVLYLRVGEVQC